MDRAGGTGSYEEEEEEAEVVDEEEEEEEVEERSECLGSPGDCDLAVFFEWESGSGSGSCSGMYCIFVKVALCFVNLSLLFRLRRNPWGNVGSDWDLWRLPDSLGPPGSIFRIPTGSVCMCV